MADGEGRKEGFRRSGGVRTSLVVALAAVLACSGIVLALPSLRADGVGEPTVTVTGSSTVAPLVTEMARRFESSVSSGQVDVQAGGSARGIGDARRGLADLGMVYSLWTGHPLHGERHRGSLPPPPRPEPRLGR